MSDSPIFYIKFLKPPPTECIIGQQFPIVWTIESDLGDVSYWEPVPVTCVIQGTSELRVNVINDNKGKRNNVAQKSYMRSPTNKAASLVYNPLQGGGMVTHMTIEETSAQSLPVGTSISVELSLMLSSNTSHQTTHPVWYQAQQLLPSSTVWLIPIWSMPIQLTVAKQRHLKTSGGDQAQRLFQLDTGAVIRISEDAEESIARHVWDCGLGMCQFMAEHKNEIKGDCILELGSGTGLVGIYAGKLLNSSQVYLTDLADALGIMQQNVDINHAENIEVAELSWGSHSADDRYKTVNLVLLTDVLYNQGSHDVLLDTLEWLLENENSKALLSYKERNPAERDFFMKIKSRGFMYEQVMGTEHLICEVYWITKETR
ncbi:putative methyltransferase-domain-containing protein [Pilobolus umbonatus]|nr:putative methyltransferase-domain-containing protein [Pilobolus umbonatus]